MANDDFLSNADDPISKAEQDMLQRGAFVKRLAAVLKSAPPHSSNVFALFGEWGSGKTSVKNLVVRQLEESTDKASPIIVEFNPWGFSTQEELFSSFFSEVSLALGRKDAGDVAVALNRLGGYLSIGSKVARTAQLAADLALLPGGGLFGVLAESMGKGSERAKESAEDLRSGRLDDLQAIQTELRTALAKLNRSVLIVIDDIDRLPSSQVMQMFQVVRVNAALPRINFLLLIDRESVLESLKQAHQSADYLEKVVQFSLDMPRLAPDELHAFAKAGLEEVIKSAQLQPRVDWERWERSYIAGCQLVLDTPRKVRRLLHTFRFHLTIFSEDGVPEVDIVDLFFLEVLRLYVPALWAELFRVGRRVFGRGLLNWYFENAIRDDSAVKVELDTLLQSVPEDIRPAAKYLIKELIPQLSKHSSLDEVAALKTCRMGTELHFDSYFLLRTNADYPTHREIEQLTRLLHNPPKFSESAKALTKTYGLKHVLPKLQAVLSEPADRAAITALLATVWQLSLEQAASAEVIRSFDYHEYAKSFSAFFLVKLPDDATRVETALTALHESKAIHPLLLIAANDETALRENPHARDRTFTLESTKTLKHACVDRILAEKDANRLIYQPDLNYLLWAWANEQGNEPVRLWVREQAEEIWRIATVLSHFFNSSTSSRDGTRYYISPKSLDRWFDLDEPFLAKLGSFDRSGLDQWRNLAIDEAIRVIKQKLAGVGEVPDSPDSNDQ